MDENKTQEKNCLPLRPLVSKVGKLTEHHMKSKQMHPHHKEIIHVSLIIADTK